jgi:voltage-gated potassium channel Kch
MGRLFTIKCMIVEHPIAFISLLCLLVTCVLSYCLRIVEYDIDADHSLILSLKGTTNDFRYFIDALWFIYVTFLTIGYGEYSPKTNLGRLIGIATAILGTILVSLLAVTVQEYYNLKIKEKNVK